MNIDLSLLLSHNVNEINIDDNYEIPKDYYEKSDILELKNVRICGKITLAFEEEDDKSIESPYIDCDITGTMIIEDSISLEPVDYDFSIKYDDFIEENCINYENLLDIFLFLWENIVLEIPLQYTKVKDLKRFSGDGWRLVNEDELVFENNPFKDLLNDFEKE